MRNLSPLAKAQHAVRANVCTSCQFRPEGSEAWDAHTRRPCEDECTIFINLPKLRTIVHDVHDPQLGPYERATRELVCLECQSNPTAGDYCADRSTAHCPLAVYMRDVVDVLERLDRSA
jgi:hypothetical protein